MADLPSWITPAELALFMGLDTPPDNAQAAIDAACAAIRTYLGQDITYVADDVQHADGKGGDAGRAAYTVRLRQRPVRGVTEVIIHDTVVDPADYVVRGAVVKLLHHLAFPWGIDNIHITYTHGYDFTGDYYTPDDMPVPADLVWWTQMIARRFSGELGTAPEEGIVSESIGAYSYTKDTASVATTSHGSLTASEAAGLDLYAVRLAI